jgi:hypothetical protein
LISDFFQDHVAVVHVCSLHLGVHSRRVGAKSRTCLIISLNTSTFRMALASDPSRMHKICTCAYHKAH